MANDTKYEKIARKIWNAVSESRGANDLGKSTGNFPLNLELAQRQTAQNKYLGFPTLSEDNWNAAWKSTEEIAEEVAYREIKEIFDEETKNIEDNTKKEKNMLKLVRMLPLLLKNT